jgi:serine/threonine protein kinase
MAIAAGTRFNHYEILTPLGAGGMGEVYLAEDERLRRRVALKVLPESIAQDTDRLRRFEHEAFAASALNHPNILTIYEFGAEGATHFLASEFIDGETLCDRLQRTPLALHETLDITIQTAQALATALATDDRRSKRDDGENQQRESQGAKIKARC